MRNRRCCRPRGRLGFVQNGRVHPLFRDSGVDSRQLCRAGCRMWRSFRARGITHRTDRWRRPIERGKFDQQDLWPWRVLACCQGLDGTVRPEQSQQHKRMHEHRCRHRCSIAGPGAPVSGGSPAGSQRKASKIHPPDLSASVGWMRSARRAGTMHAATPTVIMSAAIGTSTRTSDILPAGVLSAS